MTHRPNSFTGELIQYKQFDKYTKTLLKNSAIKDRRNREKKEKRGRQREKSMGREEARRGDSVGVRREKKTMEREEMREFIVKKAE